MRRTTANRRPRNNRHSASVPPSSVSGSVAATAIRHDGSDEQQRSLKGFTVISIIIPAHNESTVIGRLLTALAAGPLRQEMDIVVVCNGCTDDTAAIIRQIDPQARVIETDVANKVHALNLADAASTAFPRLYIDADIVVTQDTVRKLATRLLQGPLAVAPRPRIVTDGCSLPVRAYFTIQRMLPSAREGIGGSGVYGLSETGRRRFSVFPPVTADDGFVRIQFAGDERETVEGAVSLVQAPRRLRHLVSIKSRSHFGKYELARLYPHLWQNKGRSNHASLLKLYLRPWLWPALVIYTWAMFEARRQAKRRIRSHRETWQRDDTSRTPPGPARTIGQSP
jgi:glycosyltransferase involved in cell wall biosynthesis